MTSSRLIAPARATASLEPPPRVGQTVLELPGIEVRAYRTYSLGNWSYLVVSEGEAAVVDPQRDMEPVGGKPGSDARLRYVVETHIHSDYLSGATRLVHDLGSEVVASVRSEYAFAHRALKDGDAIRFGVAELRLLATPGHTREHAAWTLHFEGDPSPVAVFSGGSLISGGAGRTDVHGSASVPILTWLQFQSIRRVAELPETTLLLPTHGCGSTCGTSTEFDVGGFRTVGDERAANGLLGLTYEAFRDALVKDRPPVPTSFRSISRQNRLGPRPVDPPMEPVRLSPGNFARVLGNGAWAIDLRGRHEFAAEHVLGSLNIEPTDAFLSQLGSIVPHGVPLELIAGSADERHLSELALDCYRIGYPVAGVLDGGLDAWQADRRVVASYPAVSADVVIRELIRGQELRVLDVRDPLEWREGTLDGADLIPLGRLVSDAEQLDGQPGIGAPITVACRGGARAAVAASYLARRGMDVRPMVEGGIPALIEALGALGYPAATGLVFTAGHAA